MEGLTGGSVPGPDSCNLASDGVEPEKQTSHQAGRTGCDLCQAVVARALDELGGPTRSFPH